jgi:ribosomal protein S18 acetylase RimI-like enzyme
MGRLAISVDFRGQGLGAALLADAATKALRDSAAAFALVVDAKDEQSAQFYEHEGFLRLESHPMTLLLPLATFRRQAERTSSPRHVLTALYLWSDASIARERRGSAALQFCSSAVLQFCSSAVP